MSYHNELHSEVYYNLWRVGALSYTFPYHKLSLNHLKTEVICIYTNALILRGTRLIWERSRYNAPRYNNIKNHVFHKTYFLQNLKFFIPFSRFRQRGFQFCWNGRIIGIESLSINPEKQSQLKIKLVL